MSLVNSRWMVKLYCAEYCVRRCGWKSPYRIDRLESCPILSAAALGADDTVKRIRISGDTILTEKRQVKLRLGDSAATSERRLSAELRQHELLDRVIEKSPARANAGLAGIARTPGNADAGSKGLVISLSHARRNAGVARNDQPDRVLRRAIGVGDLRKDRP